MPGKALGESSVSNAGLSQNIEQMNDSRGPYKAPPGLDVLTSLGKKDFEGANERYALEEVLGEGSYGSVYRCHRMSDNAVLAVKIIDTMRIGFVGGPEGVKAAEIMAAREVDALRQLAKHPGVISLHAAFFSESTRQVFIVTDFVPGSHLFSHVVQRSEPLKEAEASHIVAQLGDALSFCHALGIVHRDLKLENVLVSGVDVRLAEWRDPSGETSWRTEEIFTVKLCDFGFAKSLEKYTTRTPVGTGTYCAPEIGVDKKRTSKSIQASPLPAAPEKDQYDAFKADAYSLGVMVFVMLVLGFPDRGDSHNSHRKHKSWPDLSADAQSLIDGLLCHEPDQRLSIVDTLNHQWVKIVEPEDCKDSVKRKASKTTLLRQAEAPWQEKTKKNPQPKWRHQHSVQDPALPGVLGLHRALVHIQQERGMACWALCGGSAIGNLSCWDQLQWHVQLTEKRIHAAKALLGPAQPAEALTGLFADLTKARKLGLSAAKKSGTCLYNEEFFDRVFSLYNEACGSLIEIVAKALENVRPNSPEGRRAARRYRLFSAAAEQLGRERAFLCGPLMGSVFGNCQHGPGKQGATRDGVEAPERSPMSSERMRRLGEIIGARKILLGTTVTGIKMAGDVVASSTGLIGTLMSQDEPSILSVADIAELEAIELRVLAPFVEETVPSKDHMKHLDNLEILGGWTEEDKAELNKVINEVRLTEGEVLMTEGAPNGKYYVLVEGSCQCSSQGNESRLLQAGSDVVHYFGEQFWTSAAASETIIVTSPSATALELDQKDFNIVWDDIIESPSPSFDRNKRSCTAIEAQEEWYQTITRLLNDIHSRIAVGLVEDMRITDMKMDLDMSPRVVIGQTRKRNTGKGVTFRSNGGCCRAGLKKLLQSMADRL